MTVPLDALNAPGVKLGVATIDIVYDPNVLVPIACDDDPGLVFDASVCNLGFGPGTIRFVGISLNGLLGDIPLANITFQGLGTGTLVVDIITYADPNGVPLPAVAQNGFITVGPEPGDVDCDDDIDAVDALFVLQFVSGSRTGSSNCPPLLGQLYLPAADAEPDG